MQFEAEPVSVYLVEPVERDVGHGLGLAHGDAGVLGGNTAGIGPERVEPDAGGPHAQHPDPGVVGLAELIVPLGHIGGALLLEEVHSPTWSTWAWVVMM